MKGNDMVYGGEYNVVNSLFFEQKNEKIPEEDPKKNPPDKGDDAEKKLSFAGLETSLIKKIVVVIISFVANIVSFFRDRNRLRKLQENQNIMAVSIKEKQKNGDYQVVNCLYDRQDNKLVDPEEDAVLITAKQLDAETQSAFGSKDMLVLR